MENFTVKRLLRRPWLSLLGLTISALLCLLLCVLAGTLSAERQRLEDVRQSYEILCVVSDVRGTTTEKLGMTHIYTDFLTDPEEGIGGYVKDLRLTKSFTCSGPGVAGQLIGVSNPRCSPLLDEAKGGNYACDAADFFESRRYLCLLPQELYERYGGGSLTLQVRDPAGSSPTNPSGTDMEVEFQVVGWYLGGSGEIFMPYPAAQQLAAQLAPYATTDSAAFLLADNSKVQELTEAVEAMPMMAERTYVVVTDCDLYRLPLDERDRAKALTLNREYKARYDTAYQHLAAAAVLEKAEELHDAAAAQGEVQRVHTILDTLPNRKGGTCRKERRFLSAISCQGMLHLHDTVNLLCKQIYYLRGHGVLEQAVALAEKKTGHLILCPRPLRPEQLEAVLLPEQGIAFLRAPAAVKVPQGECLQSERALAAGIEELRAAKGLHDKLEAIYRPYMDFDALTRYTNEYIEKLFS